MALATILITIAGIAGIFFVLLHTRTRNQPAKSSATRSDSKRGVLLHQVNQLEHEDSAQHGGIDIIAIHGFDTNSPDTWIYKEGGKADVNWLADEHMLPAEVSNVRIFTCDWPAELFQTSDHAPDSIEELARLLLAGISGRDSHKSSRATKDRPILFVASCLGGVILMQALVMAENECRHIREAARGIIFLATPFCGTSFEDVAKWAEPGLTVWALVRGRQVSSMLDWVSLGWSLDELVRNFSTFWRSKASMGPGSFEVSTFYEKQPTKLSSKAPAFEFIPFLFPPPRQVS
jgi:hypothetical protein